MFLGLGLLSQFPPFRYFPNFTASPKCMIAIENHVHIWQVSPREINKWNFTQSLVNSTHKGPEMRSFNIIVVRIQTVELSVIWDSLTLSWHHCKEWPSVWDALTLLWYQSEEWPTILWMVALTDKLRRFVVCAPGGCGGTETSHDSQILPHWSHQGDSYAVWILRNTCTRWERQG